MAEEDEDDENVGVYIVPPSQDDLNMYAWAVSCQEDGESPVTGERRTVGQKLSDRVRTAFDSSFVPTSMNDKDEEWEENPKMQTIRRILRQGHVNPQPPREDDSEDRRRRLADLSKGIQRIGPM